MNYPPRGDRVLVRRLEAKLSAESLKPSYVVLTSGPRHLEAKAEGEDRQKDRAVEVCVAIDHQVEKRGGDRGRRKLPRHPDGAAVW